MAGEWGWFLLMTVLLAPGWYLADKMLLRPALREKGTPLLAAVVRSWRGIGLLVLIALTTALMAGNAGAMAVTIAAALFVYTLIAASVWLIAPRLGQGVPDIVESESYDRACKLLITINQTLQHAPLSDAQASSIREQANAIPRNIADSLRKLDRLRQIERLVRGEARTRSACDRPTELAELRALESQLKAAIQSSLEVLMGIPVSLMKVELARDDRAVARIVSDLTESNLRLTDLAESWEEVNRTSPIVKSATSRHHSA